MRNHVLAAVIAAALAGCAVCAEPYATGPYAMMEDAPAAAPPSRVTWPVEPKLNHAEPDDPAEAERKSKTQSQ